MSWIIWQVKLNSGRYMVSTFLKPFILNILACVIFLLALTNVIGFVFSTQRLAAFGHAVGFSLCHFLLESLKMVQRI